MGLLTIDESKCRKDGICVKDCPATIIRLAEGGGYPEIVPGGEAACVVCGHCVAVCPHGALSHKAVPLESCPPLDAGLTINQGQAIQFLRSRRSVRLYQERPVEREKIGQLIEVARCAPTASNSQLVEWLVLTDRSDIHKVAVLAAEWLRRLLEGNPRLAEVNPHLARMVDAWDAGFDSILRRAPMLVVASAPREAVNGMVDVTIALSYLDLLAPSLGLGTCWAGVLQGAMLASSSIRETVGVPAQHPHYYSLMVGYPAVKYHRLPERRLPKITFR